MTAALRALSERLEFVHSLSTRCVLRTTQQDITRDLGHGSSHTGSSTHTGGSAHTLPAAHAVYEFDCRRSGKQVRGLMF